MKSSLKAGLTHRFAYTVPRAKTVPHLYAEARELQAMPEVFATGFMVGAHGMDLCATRLRRISTRARAVSAYISTCTHKSADAAWDDRHRRSGVRRGEGAARELQASRP